MSIQRYRVSITTIADGSATGYATGSTPGAVPPNGAILGIYFVPDGTAPYTTTGDVTITGEDTGNPIFATLACGTAAIWWIPLAVSHKAEDAVALTADESRKPPLIAGERIKIVLANCGDTKTGVFHFFVG